MFFLFMFFVLNALASILGASHPTPPNPSPIQAEDHTNPSPPAQSPGHPPPSGQNLLKPQVPVRVSPSSPDHGIQPEQQCNPNPLSQAPIQRNPAIPFPLIQRFFQSPNQSLPPPSPPIRIPWYRGNEFVAMEPAPHGPLPHEFHIMDCLSLCVLNYFFACGLSYTSTWSQRPSLSTSIHIQCFLNQAAFSLFLLANALLPRTRPALAFVLDRLSFFLIVISAYLASMPMFPPYFAIIMFIVVILVYIFARFRG